MAKFRQSFRPSPSIAQSDPAPVGLPPPSSKKFEPAPATRPDPHFPIAAQRSPDFHFTSNSPLHRAVITCLSPNTSHETAYSALTAAQNWLQTANASTISTTLGPDLPALCGAIRSLWTQSPRKIRTAASWVYSLMFQHLPASSITSVVPSLQGSIPDIPTVYVPPETGLHPMILHLCLAIEEICGDVTGQLAQTPRAHPALCWPATTAGAAAAAPGTIGGALAAHLGVGVGEARVDCEAATVLYHRVLAGGSVGAAVAMSRHTDPVTALREAQTKVSSAPPVMELGSEHLQSSGFVWAVPASGHVMPNSDEILSTVITPYLDALVMLSTRLLPELPPSTFDVSRSPATITELATMLRLAASDPSLLPRCSPPRRTAAALCEVAVAALSSTKKPVVAVGARLLETPLCVLHLLRPSRFDEAPMLGPLTGQACQLLVESGRAKMTEIGESISELRGMNNRVLDISQAEYVVDSKVPAALSAAAASSAVAMFPQQNSIYRPSRGLVLLTQSLVSLHAATNSDSTTETTASRAASLLSALCRGWGSVVARSTAPSARQVLCLPVCGADDYTPEIAANLMGRAQGLISATSIKSLHDTLPASFHFTFSEKVSPLPSTMRKKLVGLAILLSKCDTTSSNSSWPRVPPLEMLQPLTTFPRSPQAPTNTTNLWLPPWLPLILRIVTCSGVVNACDVRIALPHLWYELGRLCTPGLAPRAVAILMESSASLLPALLAAGYNALDDFSLLSAPPICYRAVAFADCPHLADVPELKHKLDSMNFSVKPSELEATLSKTLDRHHVLSRGSGADGSFFTPALKRCWELMTIDHGVTGVTARAIIAGDIHWAIVNSSQPAAAHLLNFALSVVASAGTRLPMINCTPSDLGGRDTKFVFYPRDGFVPPSPPIIHNAEISAVATSTYQQLHTVSSNLLSSEPSVSLIVDIPGVVFCIHILHELSPQIAYTAATAVTALIDSGIGFVGLLTEVATVGVPKPLPWIQDLLAHLRTIALQQTTKFSVTLTYAELYKRIIRTFINHTPTTTPEVEVILAHCKALASPPTLLHAAAASIAAGSTSAPNVTSTMGPGGTNPRFILFLSIVLQPFTASGLIGRTAALTAADAVIAALALTPSWTLAGVDKGALTLACSTVLQTAAMAPLEDVPSSLVRSTVAGAADPIVTSCGFIRAALPFVGSSDQPILGVQSFIPQGLFAAALVSMVAWANLAMPANPLPIPPSYAEVLTSAVHAVSPFSTVIARLLSITSVAAGCPKFACNLSTAYTHLHTLFGAILQVSCTIQPAASLEASVAAASGVGCPPSSPELTVVYRAIAWTAFYAGAHTIQLLQDALLRICNAGVSLDLFPGSISLYNLRMTTSHSRDGADRLPRILAMNSGELPQKVVGHALALSDALYVVSSVIRHDKTMGPSDEIPTSFSLTGLHMHDPISSSSPLLELATHVTLNTHSNSMLMLAAAVSCGYSSLCARIASSISGAVHIRALCNYDIGGELAAHDIRQGATVFGRTPSAVHESLARLTMGNSFTYAMEPLVQLFARPDNEIAEYVQNMESSDFAEQFRDEYPQFASIPVSLIVSTPAGYAVHRSFASRAFLFAVSEVNPAGFLRMPFLTRSLSPNVLKVMAFFDQLINGQISTLIGDMQVYSAQLPTYDQDYVVSVFQSAENALLGNPGTWPDMAATAIASTNVTSCFITLVLATMRFCLCIEQLGAPSPAAAPGPASRESSAPSTRDSLPATLSDILLPSHALSRHYALYGSAILSAALGACLGVAGAFYSRRIASRVASFSLSSSSLIMRSSGLGVLVKAGPPRSERFTGLSTAASSVSPIELAEHEVELLIHILQTTGRNATSSVVEPLAAMLARATNISAPTRQLVMDSMYTMGATPYMVSSIQRDVVQAALAAFATLPTDLRFSLMFASFGSLMPAATKIPTAGLLTASILSDCFGHIFGIPSFHAVNAIPDYLGDTFTRKLTDTTLIDEQRAHLYPLLRQVIKACLSNTEFSISQSVSSYAHALSALLSTPYPPDTKLRDATVFATTVLTPLASIFMLAVTGLSSVSHGFGAQLLAPLLLTDPALTTYEPFATGISQLISDSYYSNMFSSFSQLSDGHYLRQHLLSHPATAVSLAWAGANTISHAAIRKGVRDVRAGLVTPPCDTDDVPGLAPARTGFSLEMAASPPAFALCTSPRACEFTFYTFVPRHHASTAVVDGLTDLVTVVCPPLLQKTLHLLVELCSDVNTNRPRILNILDILRTRAFYRAGIDACTDPSTSLPSIPEATFNVVSTMAGLLLSNLPLIQSSDAVRMATMLELAPALTAATSCWSSDHLLHPQAPPPSFTFGGSIPLSTVHTCVPLPALVASAPQTLFDGTVVTALAGRARVELTGPSPLPPALLAELASSASAIRAGHQITARLLVGWSGEAVISILTPFFDPGTHLQVSCDPTIHLRLEAATSSGGGTILDLVPCPPSSTVLSRLASELAMISIPLPPLRLPNTFMSAPVADHLMFVRDPRSVGSRSLLPLLPLIPAMSPSAASVLSMRNTVQQLIMAKPTLTGMEFGQTGIFRPFAQLLYDIADGNKSNASWLQNILLQHQISDP